VSLKDTKTKEKEASHSTFPVLRELLGKKDRDIQKDDRRLDSRVNSTPITAISTMPSMLLVEIPSSDTDSASVSIGAHIPTSPTWLFTPEHGCWVSHRQTEDYFGNVSQTVPVDVSGDDSGDEVHSPTTSTPPSRYNSKVPVVTPSLASTPLECAISGNTVISPKFQIIKTKEDGKLHRKAKRNPLGSFLDMDE